VRIDYGSAQKATAGQHGLLTSTDFADFASRAPGNAPYLTTTDNAGLSAESNLGLLTTGLLKITVGGGIAVPSTAVAGTDYVAPAGLAVKVDTTRTISTTSPITGGGNLTQDRTIGCATCVTTAAPLTPDAPLFAAGASSVAMGSLSGTTTIVGTVSAAPGAKTINKQVIFDTNGNLVASAFDAGVTGGGSATWGGIGGTLSNQVDLQNALNTKPTATLSTNTNLGTANDTVPSQNAVKVYVDAGLATKQNTITADAGLSSSGSGWFTASTEANFLTQNASSDLQVGAGHGGKMAVRTDTGRLQYSAGATPILYSGYLLPSPLSYNISAGTCTGDANAGKLTINASNQVICAADQGGGGGGGTVTSITATAPIQVTAGEITTAGVVSIADAAADGTTKGAATFNANDFSSAAGVISLDYTTGQTASTNTTGFLTDTDWDTFNNKQDALGFTAVPDTRTINGHQLDQNVVVTAEDVGLDNLTNVAQLTRAAGDFEAAGITEKATPVGDDVVLLEDSAGGAKTKKWAKLSNLPAAGITVKEVDDTPTASAVTEIRVSADTLTEISPGIVSIATGGGPGGGGDASTALGSGQSVAGEVTVFADNTGKLLTHATGSGIALLTDGVLSTVAAPSSALAGVSDPQTLTNKAIPPRESVIPSAASFPCNADSADLCTMVNTEAPATTLSIAAPDGVNLENGQKLAYRIQCTNPLPYSFNAAFRFPGDVPQPLTCSTAGPDYWLASWHSTSSTWDILTVIQTSGASGSTGGHIIQDEGISLTAQGKLNFTGNIQCAANPGAGAIDCNVPVGAEANAYATVVNQSTLPALTPRPTLDIVGTALVASDDDGNNRTRITLNQSPAASTSVVGTGRILTLNGTANEIAITGSVAQNLTSDPVWTIGIPDNAQLSIAKLTNLTTNGVVATTGGDGTLTTIAAMTNPMTTAGDLIIGGVAPAGTPTRLAGAAGFLKGAAGSGPTWSAVDLSTGDVTGDLPYANLAQAQAASRLLGRGSAAGAGDWQETTVSSPLAFSGTALGCATCTTNAAALTANQLVIGGGSQATAALGSLGTTTTVLHGNAGGVPSFGAVVSADLNITTTNCTNQFVTGLSAGAVGTCTTATLASAQFANQGTTTTVLHGNAAGNPSFGAVSLTTDVSGDLPYSSLAQAGAASKLLGRGGAAGAGDWEEITLGTNLSMSGTTLNASGASLPDGDKGDITTSGSGATWTVDAAAITYAKIQDVSATDRLLGRDTAGAGSIEELTPSAAKTMLAIACADLTDEGGGCTMSTTAGGDLTGTLPSPTITAGAVTFAKMQNVTASRLLGRGSAAGDGAPQELTVTSPLTISATALTLGDIALGTGTSGNYVRDVLANVGLKKTTSESETQVVDLAVDSTEAGFLTAGDLGAACGAGTAGKMTVQGTLVQYCDNAVTPARQYAALGNNLGAATALATTVTSLGSVTSVNGTSIPNAVTLTNTTDKLSVFAATSSAELAGVLSDESGTTGGFQRNPMTTAGDLTYGGASGVPTRLAGAVGLLYNAAGSAPSWADAATVKTFLADLTTAPSIYASGQVVYGAGANRTTASSSGLVLDATDIVSRKDKVTIDNDGGALGVHNIISCSPGAGNVTFTLPDTNPTPPTVGSYKIIKRDNTAGECRVQVTTGETLNGTTDGLLAATTQDSEVEVTWIGTGAWHGSRGKTTLELTDVGDNLLTAAKLAFTATDKLIGRDTAGAGAGEELGVTGALSISGGNLQVASASETVAGVAELATAAEVTTGTDAARAVTPASLAGYASATKTLTNTTLDGEGTGNTLTTSTKVWLPAASCQNTTATLFWDTRTSAPPVAACATSHGVADYATDSGALSMHTTLLLPSDWTGVVSGKVLWFSAATANDVAWQVDTVCVADAEADTITFANTTELADTAKGVASQLNATASATITTTGCAAGELLHVQVRRDPADAQDTFAAGTTARFYGLELTIRRAQ
jgi:hypothetical protein